MPDAGSGTSPLGAGGQVGSFAGYSFCNPNSLILGVETVSLGKMALTAALVSFDSCASGVFFFFCRMFPGDSLSEFCRGSILVSVRLVILGKQCHRWPGLMSHLLIMSPPLF